MTTLEDTIKIELNSIANVILDYFKRNIKTKTGNLKNSISYSIDNDKIRITLADYFKYYDGNVKVVNNSINNGKNYLSTVSIDNIIENICVNFHENLKSK